MKNVWWKKTAKMDAPVYNAADSDLWGLGALRR